MADVSFFDTPTIASRIKHRIVSKYFAGWANIVLPQALAHEGRIMYVDLFCGPGRYQDGTPSIPLLILQHAVDTPALHDTLQTVFNDENPAFVETLRDHIGHIPGIERLKYQPVLRSRTIGRDTTARVKRNNVPALYFADPWGYEGISIDLIEAALSHWGSDFLFFFNYNRINMHLGSDLMSGPIDEFFSSDRARQLRQTVARLSPFDREQAVLKAMKDAAKALRAEAGIFTYRSDIASRPTHHLMCVSKHRQAMALFKEISAKESTCFDDDVPSLEHNPGANPAQGSLFSPLDQLQEDLVMTFAGKTGLTAEQIYHEHHNGRPYVLKNYRQALLRLEESGDVVIDPPRYIRRPSDTIPGSARISFPKVG
jgi:three-Cys-motif partner protein